MAELIVNDLKRYTVEPLYQWDIDQQLVIYGLNILEPEIHFTNEAMTRAIVKQSTVDSSGVITVDVPNTLLQKPYSINVYVCGYEDSTFKTYYKVIVPVKARPKPGDYTFEDTDGEIYSYNALEKMVTDGVKTLEAEYEEFTTKANSNYSTFTNQVDNRVSTVENQMNELNDLVSGKTSLGDAETLNGHDSTYFATQEAITNIENGTTTVGNSTKLNGQNASYYATKTSVDNLSTDVSNLETNIVNGNTKITANVDTDYTTSRTRNISLTTTTPTSIPNGSIVGVYE